MRVLKDAYNTEWEEKRRVEMNDLQNRGIIPVMNENVIEKKAEFRPLLMGQAIGGVHEQLPAAVIVNQMVTQAAEIMKTSNGYLKASKL